MAFSAIARIESYKHYEAGGVHKEAVRELPNYEKSNPNWNWWLVDENVYFERMELDKPFEQWIYDYREKNGITGRYIEHSANPKSETNAMCQALFTVPGYIDNIEFTKKKQIEILRHCYNFFKQEFPNVPILEAVCHFDETSPHLHITFLPVVEREHKKRGKEKIFSTTQLMQGKDFFPKFQDRYFAYMKKALRVDLERKKDSGIKHIPPKEYRAYSEEKKVLEEKQAVLNHNIKAAEADLVHLNAEIAAVRNSSDYALSQRVEKLEKENRLLKSFLSLVFKKIPALEQAFQKFIQPEKKQQFEIDR